MVLDKSIELFPISSSEIKIALGKYYRKSGGRVQEAIAITDVSNDTNILDKLIVEAKDLGASDIHFEPFEKVSRVRYRIDGVLVEKYQLQKEDYPGMINKIKIKANLDIAEKRLPQDGRKGRPREAIRCYGSPPAIRVRVEIVVLEIRPTFNFEHSI